MRRVIDQARLIQNKFLADARLLLKPGEVESEKIPVWLSKRVTAFCREHKASDHSAFLRLHNAVRMTAFDACSSWLDHWGYSKNTQGQYDFVSEPYAFFTREAKSVEAFCEALGGLCWYLSSNSWWYPGHTHRIVIEPPRDFSPGA